MPGVYPDGEEGLLNIVALNMGNSRRREIRRRFFLTENETL